MKTDTKTTAKAAATKAAKTVETKAKKAATATAAAVESAVHKAEETAVKAEKAAVKAEKAAEKVVKKTVAKAPARRKAVKETVYLQYHGKEIDKDTLTARVRDIWTGELGNKEADLKEITLYLKPEENAAYYVINQDVTGKINL